MPKALPRRNAGMGVRPCFPKQPAMPVRVQFGVIPGNDGRMNPGNPDLSIIVVSYGTRALTLGCLDSIRAETEVPYDLIVVDNASPDDSCAAIRTHFPEVRLVALSENRGFAAACNRGAAEARGAYILLLNPDTIVRGHAIDRLLNFARQRPGAGIWGGRTIYEDGTLNPLSCSRRPTLWNLLCSGLALDTRFRGSAVFDSLNYGNWQRDSEREVDIVSGCFLLIKRDLWDRLGGFAPEFFMYGEDTDLCLRAHALGFHPRITPDATIVHAGSGTEDDKIRKIRQVLAARALLVRKHFSPLLRPLALMLIALRPMVGRVMARRELRPLWSDIWALRRDWLAGRY